MFQFGLGGRSLPFSVDVMKISSVILAALLLCVSAQAEPVRISLEKQQLQLASLKRQHAALRSKMLQAHGAQGESDITIYNFMDAQVRGLEGSFRLSPSGSLVSKSCWQVFQTMFAHNKYGCARTLSAVADGLPLDKPGLGP